MTNLPRAARPRSSVGVSQLFRARREQMARLAYVLTTNAEVADEIVQDAFLAVHANWERIDDPNAFLRTAVVNGCYSYLRRLRVERRVPITRAASSSLNANEMRDALAKLPYSKRAVLALRYFCDLADEEIAHTLGCRLATVRSRAARALADLRKEIPQ